MLQSCRRAAVWSLGRCLYAAHSQVKSTRLDVYSQLACLAFGQSEGRRIQRYTCSQVQACFVASSISLLANTAGRTRMWLANSRRCLHWNNDGIPIDQATAGFAAFWADVAGHCTSALQRSDKDASKGCCRVPYMGCTFGYMSWLSCAVGYGCHYRDAPMLAVKDRNNRLDWT
jgi:hypothetical protein